MLSTLIDFIYPRRCPICGEIAMPKPEKACTECIKLLQVIREPRCKKCSKPLDDEEQEYCLDCVKKKHHYEKGYALWVYDKTMKKSIADFKFHYRQEYADFYIEQLSKQFCGIIDEWRVDALVPIPLHKSKLRVRGFNQADLLARGLGKQLGIPVLSEYLTRCKKTLPQKELNDKERFKNLTEAFSFTGETYVNKNQIKNIVLVDDIYTTGSTIEACTKILHEQGIEKVYFISLCIGKGY